MTVPPSLQQGQQPLRTQQGHPEADHRPADSGHRLTPAACSAQTLEVASYSGGSVLDGKAVARYAHADVDTAALPCPRGRGGRRASGSASGVLGLLLLSRDGEDQAAGRVGRSIDPTRPYPMDEAGPLSAGYLCESSFTR